MTLAPLAPRCLGRIGLAGLLSVGGGGGPGRKLQEAIASTNASSLSDANSFALPEQL
jgi:hypothetical protein